MDTQTVKQPTNRIDADLKAWERMEAHFSKRYGANVWRNRESQKVRRDIYAHILKQYGTKKLNREEKMEYRMLKGQVREMNKQLYPNPWVRLARNILMLGVNIVKGIGSVLLIIPKAVIAVSKYEQPANQVMQYDGKQAGLRVAYKNSQPQLAKKQASKNGQQQQAAKQQQPDQQKSPEQKGQAGNLKTAGKQPEKAVLKKTNGKVKYFQPENGNGIRI